METTVKFAYVNVDNSITNPNATNIKDLNTPFSFTDFLKYTNNLYTPTIYNELYIDYIKRWYNTKNEITVTEDEFIQKQYIELLKEITLTYTSDDERRYLQNVNFEDPEDLEIIIPFYARKIKEIVIFYKERRDKLKFVVERNKRKTTAFSIDRAAREIIIDYLFDSNTRSTLNIDIDTITDNMQIDVEELIDTFGSYLDLSSPPPSYGGALRQEFFTSNINEINADELLSLSESLRKNLFNNVFLKELGVAFTINVNLNYDPICSPSNPIGDFIESKTVNGVQPDTKQKLYQQLLEKYIGVDFYYVKKNSAGEVLSGKLLTAANPSGNLVNIKNASTATVPSDQLLALKKLGLFFNEDNLGILRFNSSAFTYDVDPTVISAGETYVYPDPLIYGSNQKPVVFNIDNTAGVKNISTSFAYGDPNVEPKDQSFYSYYTNEQAFETDDINRNGLIDKFTQLYDQGYCYDWKEDVYGNEYGVFKDKLGQYLYGKLSLDDITGDSYFVKLLVFNGWLFSDFTPASSQAVYDMSGPYVGLNDVYMSGLSTNGGNFTPEVTPYYLNFRAFTPYQGIPSNYDLYPILDDTSVLINTQVLPEAQTVLSTITGTNIYRDVNQKFNLDGKMFVKDVTTNQVLPLSSALRNTFVKYPSAVRTEIYNNVSGFELYYNNLVIYTDSYLVIDKINYTENGFEPPKTYNVYVTGGQPLEKFSNTFFSPKTNEIFFFTTKVFSIAGDSINTNLKQIVPNFYSYDINKGKLVRLYPDNNTTSTELRSNYSFYDLTENEGDLQYLSIGVVEVDSLRLSYNSYNDLFSVTFVGKDSNKSPYLFDYKFKYQNGVLSLEDANFYDISGNNVFKDNINFYQISMASFSYGNVNSIPSQNSPNSIKTYPLPLTFYSLSATEVNVYTQDGYMSI
jgi:hypothetical protein